MEMKRNILFSKMWLTGICEALFGGGVEALNRGCIGALCRDVLLCLPLAGTAFFVSSCQPSDVTDAGGESLPPVHRADSVARDSLEDGQVRVGDLIINTRWDDTIYVEFLAL